MAGLSFSSEAALVNVGSVIRWRQRFLWTVQLCCANLAITSSVGLARWWRLPGILVQPQSEQAQKSMPLLSSKTASRRRGLVFGGCPLPMKINLAQERSDLNRFDIQTGPRPRNRSANGFSSKCYVIASDFEEF